MPKLIDNQLEGGGGRISTINPQTGTTYSPASSDLGKLVTLDNANPILVTVQPHATIPFEVGARIDFVQKGVGKVTFAEGLGVTIKSKGGNLSIGGQNVAVSLMKEATDVWYLLGDLIA